MQKEELQHMFISMGFYKYFLLVARKKLSTEPTSTFALRFARGRIWSAVVVGKFLARFNILSRKNADARKVVFDVDWLEEAVWLARMVNQPRGVSL